VMTSLGDVAAVTIANGAVREVQYRRLSPGVNTLDRTGRITPGESHLQDVRVLPSAFRPIGARVLPHQLRFEFEKESWEEVTIRRYTLNPDIPLTEFIARPPGAP
jgi:hypothetical protein